MKKGQERMPIEDWIFPVGEGVCIDAEKGLWSDGAFFDDEDIPVEWHPAEPAHHVRDSDVWARWLEFLETSPSAAETLLIVAKTRARENAFGSHRGSILDVTSSGP